MKKAHGFLFLFVIFIAFCLPANATDLSHVKALIKAKNDLKENPHSVRAHRVYQNLMNKEGWKEAMKEEYAKRLKEQGRTPENLYLYARLLGEAEQEKLFTELVNKFPDFPWGYYGLAYVKKQQNLYEEAISLYEQALKIDPEMHESYFQMSTVYEKLGDYAKAAESGKKAMDIDPDSAKYMACQSTYLRLMGEPRQAIPLLDKAISIDPDNKLALRQKMWAHRDREQYKEVITSSKKYLELWPDDYQAKLFLCQSDFEVFVSTNDLAYRRESQEYFSKAVAMNPSSYGPYAWMFNVYSAAGWYVYALYFNQKALDLLDKKDGKLYDALTHNLEWIPANEMGTSSFRFNEVYSPEDYVSSLEDLSQSEKTALSANPQAWKKLETIAGLDASPSIEDLNTLIEEFPDFAPAYYNRGISLLTKIF